MKKVFIILFILMLSENVFALDDIRPYVGSQLVLTNNGACSHFAEEMIYQYYGINLNLKDNKLTTWLSLRNQKFKSVDDKYYSIMFTRKPVKYSLMLMTPKDVSSYTKKKENSGHVSWVKYVYLNRYKEIIIGVLESSTVQMVNNPEWYHDCLFQYSVYRYNNWKNVQYILPIRIK